MFRVKEKNMNDTYQYPLNEIKAIFIFDGAEFYF